MDDRLKKPLLPLVYLRPEVPLSATKPSHYEPPLHKLPYHTLKIVLPYTFGGGAPKSPEYNPNPKLPGIRRIAR